MTSDTLTNATHQQIRPPPSHYNHHPHNIQHYYPNSTTSSSSASIKGCCCCLFLLFSFLALLVVVVVLVIFLAVKPKKPEYNLQQVGVQYINLSPASTTINTNSPSNSASLSLAIRMLFTAKNDNKVGIKYQQSTFNIMYRGIPLGRGTVPGFYQPAHSVRQVQTTVSVDRVNLLQADASDLVNDAMLNDRVELRIMGDVRAKIRIIGLTSPAVQVIRCLDSIITNLAKGGMYVNIYCIKPNLKGWGRPEESLHELILIIMGASLSHLS